MEFIKSQKFFFFGKAEKARVSIVPDTLVLSNLKMMEMQKRTLVIKNQSKILPVTIRYTKIAYVKVLPTEALLKPSGSVELEVQIIPAKMGTVKNDINFHLLYKPHQNSEYFLVGNASVPMVFDSKAHCKEIVPKFNEGITPKLTNEVGWMTDDIRFNTKIKTPKSVMLSHIKWDKDDNDLVAFPNDRPKSLRPWKNSVRFVYFYCFI